MEQSIKDNAIKGRFHQLFGFRLPIDIFATFYTKRIIIDIVEIDHQVALRNPDYNNINCTYKGKSGYSLSMVIKEIYGEEAYKIINDLLNSQKL